MLTPQEVSNGKLEKALFGGYDISSVDAFLEQVAQDYTALYRENGILKTKVKVLVDTVEDYRSTEDAMRKALLQAEQTAREILTAAEAKRDSIEAETAQKRSELMKLLEAEAEQRRAELRRDLAAEEAVLANAKRITSEYVDRLKSAMAAYGETLERVYDFVEPLPPQPAAESTPEPKQEEAPEPVPETKEDSVTQDTIENILGIIDRSYAAPEEKEPEDAGKGAVSKESTITKLPNIDYDEIRRQFGENYNPKK